MAEHPMLSWLRATHAEAERIAREAAAMEAAWAVRIYEDGTRDAIVYLVERKNDVAEVIGDHPHEYARHIVANDPRSVLVRVEAERAILGYHEGSHECSGPEENCMWILHPQVCPTLRALASGWRHWPGWREEWAARP